MDIIGTVKKGEISIVKEGKKCRLNDIHIELIGNIYNLKEVALKYNIKTKIKNKILEELYQKKGTDFIVDLDGDFALIIVSKKKEIHLVKDKLGSIPLFYYIYKDTFIFSTSLALMMKNENFKRIIDVQSLANFLGYMYIYEPNTIFSSTYKVEKGTIVTYKNKNIVKNNYFSLLSSYKKMNHKRKFDEEALTNEFEELFINAIKKRAKKDDQIGVFMSSGHDSTLVAKLAQEYSRVPVNTYTLGFENERDESDAATRIAKFIGSNHHSIILKDKFVKDTIRKIPKFYEEPFADPSILPNIFMIENIKDKNDLYLTGEGNDAIFINSKMYDIYNFYPRTKLFLKKIINIINKKRVYHNFSEMAQINVVSRFNYSDSLLHVKGVCYNLDRSINKRRSVVIGDLNNTVSEKYRVKTGSLARYYNLNYATPFYDTSILLKTLEIPIKEMYRSGVGKYIFDKVLYKHIEKSYFSNYKKNGFGIPLADWVKRFMLAEIKELSKEELLNKQGLFDYVEVKKLIDLFEEEPDYNKAVVLWCYYVFELWYKEYMN